MFDEEKFKHYLESPEAVKKCMSRGEMDENKSSGIYPVFNEEDRQSFHALLSGSLIIPPKKNDF